MLRPILRKTLSPILVEAGAGFDVAVVRIAQELAKRATTRSQDVAARRAYLESVAQHYAAVDPAEFYAAPPPIDDLRSTRVRDLPNGEVLDVTWSSGWSCAREDQRTRWSRWRENNTVHVRWFRRRGDAPRPTIVCIHGYRAGTFAFEERAFAAPWLFNLGLDVALFTLPFHALRAPANRRGTPLFPTADVARTNEAFGQAMWDLRRLVAHLRERASHVGVMGMSLGGYTTSLLATVEPSLDFAVPYIPVSDLTDVVVEHEALRGTVVPTELIEAGKASMALVRPLARRPVVPRERVLVVGARGDRITKTSHAEALAHHFGCELTIFQGAHLLQFGRREAFAAIAKFLARHDVIRGRK